MLSVDAGRAGSYSGELRVELGRERIAIPVSATVRPQMPGLTRLLVVETPFSKFSTSDAKLFTPWLELISGGHFDVHYLDAQQGLPVLRKIDLAKIDVVLLGTEGLLGLRDSDITQLKQFLEAGGRMVLAANRFFVGTVGKANELLVPYGLRMNDTESRDQAEFDLGAAEIKEDPLTHGVKTLYFHRPSSVVVADSQKGKILVTVPDHPGEGFVAVAKAGQGEVIALGESLWWSWVAGDKKKESHNAALLRNLLNKRAGRAVAPPGVSQLKKPNSDFLGPSNVAQQAGSSAAVIVSLPPREELHQLLRRAAGEAVLLAKAEPIPWSWCLTAIATAQAKAGDLEGARTTFAYAATEAEGGFGGDPYAERLAHWPLPDRVRP